MDFSKYAAVIFDCDGTLADSMPLHHKSWTHAFKINNAPFVFPYELMCSWGGKGLDETVIDLNRIHGTSLDVNQVLKDQAEWIEEHLYEVKPKPEIVQLAQEARKIIPVSVASGGHREHVHITLKAIGVWDMFPIVVTRDDVKQSKPAPDIFLLAAEKMGVDPKKCLVYEDSPTGVAAAEAAGMDCIKIDP